MRLRARIAELERTRAEVLEEAAKECERLEDADDRTLGDIGIPDDVALGAQACARNIRALKGKAT